MLINNLKEKLPSRLLNCHKNSKLLLKLSQRILICGFRRKHIFLQVVLKVLLNCFDFCSMVIERRSTNDTKQVIYLKWKNSPACFAQWLEHGPQTKGSRPGAGTLVAGLSRPWSGYVWEAANGCAFLTSVFLSSPPRPPFTSLSEKNEQKKIFSIEDFFKSRNILGLHKVYSRKYFLRGWFQ